MMQFRNKMKFVWKKVCRSNAACMGIRMGLLLFTLGAALGLSASAQVGSGTITGTVQDASGAVIPGATVKLKDVGNSTILTKTSDKAGTFSFVNLSASTYQATITASGFKGLQRNNIQLHIGDQLDLPNLKLAVSGADTTVTVTAQDDITPTTSGEQSYTITDKQIQNLNIESRSAIELLDLIPGAANTGNFTGTYNRQQAGFGQNASTYTVNGNRFDQVQIVSDGAPVTDLNTAGSAAVTPNVDMISEAKVETSAFSSVQPNGPIVFETQTKSGGSNYHGEGYIQARNHIFDAEDSYTKSLGLPKPNSSFYYGGFNIGGPVLIPHFQFNHNRDKLFFFAATEITQQHVDLGPQGAIVPTALMRQGIFTASELNGLSGGVYRNFYVTNTPCAGYAYAYTPYCKNVTYANGYNGVVNPAAIDPGGLLLINSLFPLPNANPANNGQGYNLLTEIVTSDPRNQEILKLDYNLSERYHFSARYNHENENVPAPYGPYNTINYNFIPYPAVQEGRNGSDSVNGNFTATLTPTLTNELSISYTRFRQGISLNDASAVSRSQTGYPYANVYPGSDILPNVVTSYNHASTQILGGEAPPYAGIQNTTTITEGLTKKLGAHLLQFGFYDVLAGYNNQTSGIDNGTITDETATYGNYGPPPTPTPSNPYPANPLRDYQAINNTTGNEFSDLLVGNISGYTQSSTNVMAHMQNKRFDFYGEDTWKVTSRFTFNYGARLDHIAWWYDKNGLISVFNPAAYSAAAPVTAYSGLQDHATNPAINISGRKPLGFQFAPSAGFAYDFDSRGGTILRGGFGTNYYVDPGINAYSAVGAPPNLKTFSFYEGEAYPTTGPVVTPLTLSSVSSIDPASNPGVVYGSADPNDHATPVTYSWNLALSHVFPSAIHLETSYVGNTTRHLNGYYETNLVPLGSETGPYYGTYYQQLYRPYKSYGDIDYNTHNLGSNYHSLQVTASRSKGWANAWLTYTFGKALGDTCEDAFNHQNCYGIVPFDRSQSVNFSYYLILPDVSAKYLGNHKVVNGVLDGWKISGIEQYGSGTPFTDVPQGGANHNEYSGNQVIGIYGTTSTANPNGISTGNEQVNGTPDEASVPFVTCDPRRGLKAHQYFNPSCFTAPSAGHNGTFRLPYIHGPAYFNDEIGVFKDFKVHEGQHLEIRFQGFDFLNRAFDTYLQYDSSLYLAYDALNAAPTNASTGGVTTVRTGHRSVQLAAKYYF